MNLNTFVGAIFCWLLLFHQATPAICSPVTLNVGDIFDITGESEAKPLQILVKNLADHPKAKEFRLIWFATIPNMGYKATALYNRKQQTLKFYSVQYISGSPYAVRVW